MNETLVRTFSAAIMAAIALLATFAGGYIFAVFVALIATGIYYEWMRIVRGWGLQWAVGGFLYALIPALALLWIRDRSGHGLELLLWVFVVTWSTDIGAYFAGRTLGRRKLAPSISPNKTVEGLVGGMVAAAIFGAIVVFFVELPKPLILLAPLFALAAQGGDLFESWMKRRAGVKDSGNLLPGHGGLLDRLDGLVVVATLTALAWFGGLA